MTVIVNAGSTLTVTNGSGLTIGSNSTVAAGGLLDGSGAITGAFTLLNLGTIASDAPGGNLSIGTGTLTNQGTIFANNQSLTIQSPVNFTNLVGGTLTGGVWESGGTGTLAFLTGSIVTDAATITLVGAASTLESGIGSLQTIENSLATVSASGVLNLLGGRNFTESGSLVVGGTVTLGGGLFSVPSGLTINAGGNVGGFGAIDSGTVVNDAGTIEAKAGTLTVPGVQNVNGAGTLQADLGASLVLPAFGGAYSESIVNNGTIDAAFIGFSGTLDISGPYSGTGGFLIQGGGPGLGTTILELQSGLSAPVAFDSNIGELLLDAASTFHGTLSGFGNSDTIVMPDIANAHTATLNGNVLDLTTSSGSLVQTVTLNVGSMDYSNAAFTVAENVGNTQATVKVSGVQAAACYAAGTRIRTQTGEVLVEHLAAGDIVHAHFAGATPVVWTGHRHVDCRRHPEPSQVWPVRVSAHAFGPRMPIRDLVLSPDHAVFVDNVLIPIKHLVNGRTIAQEQWDTVTYFHVELGEHDVVLAEGMPAESYLENGDRGVFDNAGGVVALHPDFGMRRWDALGCAPLVVTGEKLAAVVARVLARLPREQRGGRASHRVA
jgi:hypothetical protein